MARPPAEGEAAPTFALPDAEGRLHRLEDYRGQWLLLCFYPRDFTPGCTRELCGLRDELAELPPLLAVSLDPPVRHGEFAARHTLPFPLLADDGRTAQAYGVLRRLGPWRWAARTSFLIDPTGRVQRAYLRPRPNGHAREVARDYRGLTL